MPRDFSVLTIAFRRHKHGEAGLFESAADMKQFATQDLRVTDKMVKKLGQQIENDALCVHGLDRVLNAREQADEIEIADDQLIAGWRAGIHKSETAVFSPLFASSQPNPRILASISAGGSSNVTEDSIFVEGSDPVRQELGGEDGFAAPRRAANHGSSSARQIAP